MSQEDVLKVLAKAKEPLTAREVYERLSARKDVTKNSVTTSLSKLETLNYASVTLKRSTETKNSSQPMVKAYIMHPRLRRIYGERR